MDFFVFGKFFIQKTLTGFRSYRSFVLLMNLGRNIFVNNLGGSGTY